MNIFLKKRVIENQQLSDIAIVVYIVLRIINKKNQTNYFVSINMLSWYIYGEVQSNRHIRDKIKLGLNELNDNNIVTLKDVINSDEYIYDLSQIYFETNKAILDKDYFSIVTDEEIHTIISYQSKDKFKMCRYFAYLVSTFTKPKKDIKESYDVTTGNEIKFGIGYCSIDFMASEINISEKAIQDYNKALEELKLIYIHRSPEVLRKGNGEINGITNTYGRYGDKDLVIQMANNHDDTYGWSQIKKKKQSNGNKTKSYVMKYNAFCNGKEYEYEVLKEIYFGLKQFNIDSKKKYKSDEYVKDLSVFSKYDFYKKV